MVNKKILIYEKLDYLLLPIAIINKIIGRKVYFTKLKKSWQNKKKIQFLNSLGIKWLNFHDYKIKNAGSVYKEGIEMQKEFSNLINNIQIFNVLNQKLVKKGCDVNDFRALALTQFTEVFYDFCKIIKFIDHLNNKDKNKYTIILNYHIFLDEIYKKKINNKAKLINLNYYYLPIKICKFFIEKTKLKLKNFLFKKDLNNKSLKDQVKFENFKIAYFPHQGIYYGSISKKDYFYSKDKNSNFFPSNILHFSIGDSHLEHANTKAFYKKNNINSIDFKSLGKISSTEIILSTLKIIFVHSLLFKNNVTSTFFFLRLWFLIKISLIRLEKLNNIKVAIFGYDILSPRPISIACKIKKIKTIAIQERCLAIWTGVSFFILDHYLTFNSKIEKLLNTERLGTVKKMKSIGPVRSDLLKDDVVNKKPNSLSDVLVMDSHSDVSYYKNGLSWFSNWRENLNFYENIFLLAKKNPNNKFIIKGKNYKFLEIEYFYKIKKLIKETPNIEFFSNNLNNSPYELTDKTNLVIAKYNSIVDELLFKKRSIIIYETASYPTLDVDYGKNIVVKNYDELENKFNLWKNNEEAFTNNIIEEHNKFFFNQKSNIKVYDALHEYLKNEFQYYA